MTLLIVSDTGHSGQMLGFHYLGDAFLRSVSLFLSGRLPHARQSMLVVRGFDGMVLPVYMADGSL